MGVRSSAGCPILVDGRLWGVMVASSTSPEPTPAGTETRLEEFTELVATAIANAETRAELTASRARIVATGDEARRHLERDLHDGVQQRLVSLALELRVAEKLAPSEGHDELVQQLSHIGEGMIAAVDELREVSHGIHPAILSEGGLRPALSTVARRSPVPVELEIRDVGRLPEPVEVGVYYVVSEALTNVIKHAQASFVQVDLEADEEAVRLRVQDDGVGGADAGHGSGLIGLKDRVHALGGRIEIASPVRRGHVARGQRAPSPRAGRRRATSGHPRDPKPVPQNANGPRRARARRGPWGVTSVWPPGGYFFLRTTTLTCRAGDLSTVPLPM